MSTNFKHYQKYQVYFFLYLAVICELLIVIVERDDAEAGWLQERNRLERTITAVVKEALKNMPVVAAESDDQLKIGEERTFVVGVKGLGENDKVTVPPSVTITSPHGTQTITPELIAGANQYGFKWKGTAAGIYTFRVDAGTNRIDTVLMNGETHVKLGSLDFSEPEIRRVMDRDPELKGRAIATYVNKSHSLAPAEWTIEVLANPPVEQLALRAKDIVTATGYLADMSLGIEGTTPDKVSTVNPSTGSMVPPKDAYSTWTWTGSFDKPGTYAVSLKGRDNRGSSGLSSAEAAFKVTVKTPVLRTRQYMPFAGENFEQNIAVYGLETNSDYSWKLLVDGREIENGTGPIVRHRFSDKDAGKNVKIDAQYRGRKYTAYTDSLAKNVAAFSYSVASPVDRILNLSFTEGSEYPVSNVFSFIVVACGRCTSDNYMPLPNTKINIVAETDNGDDLLKDVTYTPKVENGKVVATQVTFYLGGKIKTETDATITITAGTAKVAKKVIIVK